MNDGIASNMSKPIADYYDSKTETCGFFTVEIHDMLHINVSNTYHYWTPNRTEGKKKFTYKELFQEFYSKKFNGQGFDQRH